jgi:exopolysaccharide production protein ExoQ
MQAAATPRTIELSPNAILATVALGGLVFVATLQTLGALIFLAAGGAMMVRQPGLIVPEMMRYWAILLLPAFCLLTVFWSDYSGLSFRFALQLGVTFVIAVSIGNRVGAGDFFRLLCLLYGLAMLASLGAGHVRSDGAWLGVFGSKNAFAAVVSTFTLLAGACIFARSVGLGARLAALVAFALGLFLLIKAQSAGTLALTALACALAPFFPLLGGARPLRRGALVLFTLLGLALVGLVVLAFRDTLMNIVLDVTGKDATLTGRTELWDAAFRLIGQRPLLGAGYQAFWVQGNAQAEELWAEFLIEARAGFNFHNTYISNAVVIGILGVAIQVGILGGALVLSLRRAFSQPDASAIFAAIFLVELVLQSAIEVVAFAHFSPRSVIVVVLLVQGLAALSRPRPAPVAFRSPRAA